MYKLCRVSGDIYIYDSYGFIYLRIRLRDADLHALLDVHCMRKLHAE